jgi:hypothetical protein
MEVLISSAYRSDGEVGNACRMLMGKPFGKGPLERLRKRYENNMY